MSSTLNHVLIVDPNESVRLNVRRMLSDAKVAPLLISEASSAEDAVDAYNAPSDLRPAVIIFALSLCGEQGDEWLTTVRGQGQIFTTPIVLLGEDEDDARINVALRAGASEWLLVSSLSSSRLLRSLENVLAHHTALLHIYENERNFRDLVNALPTMVWVADETKARIFFNKGWLNFTGRSLEQEHGFGWLDRVHPEDRDRCLLQYSKAFDERIAFELEYRLLRHDGVYRWMMSRGQARYAADGQFLGYAGSVADITDRKNAEEELRQNEERLQIVLHGSPITVMTIDRDLRYTWFHNPQGGIDTSLMIGKRDDELFPPEMAQPFIEFKQEILTKNEPVHRELDFVWDGHWERFDARGEPLHDKNGEVIGLTIVSINITKRVQSEQRSRLLAEASQLLAESLDYESTLQQVTHLIVPHLADWCSVDIVGGDGLTIETMAIAHVDPEKVQWARSWREYYKPSVSRNRGLSLVVKTGKSEFYPEIPRETIQNAIANAESDGLREILQKVDIRSLMIVPLISRGQVLGGITLVWSESNRRYTQEDLVFAEELALRAATAVDHSRLYRESLIRAEEFRLLNETLELQVDERTKELQRSNQDLDQFAYIASHDLKAPLRAIDHLSTWIMEDVGHLLPDRSHEHLEKMRNRIKRMEGLLDDLLTYSRAGRFRGEATTVNTREMINRVIETVSPPETFQVTVSGDLPIIFTYVAPLETVLRNLINNAVKHHDKPLGHIEIRVEDAGDDMIRFAVSDDGPGIDPAFHERIFQMFQTLRPRDQVEGSGIGLSVVEKIVSNVGGTIDVESTLGEGATFSFTWPRQYGS